MTWPVVAILVCLRGLETPVHAEAPLRTTLPSQVLGETREMIVHLPESYSSKPEQRYPGHLCARRSQPKYSHRSHRGGMARNGLMPELIVVGLPNVRGGRPRDYTPPFMTQDPEDATSPMGRADQFLAFLKKELIPHVEGQYRVTPVRMLAGHSRGGLFVTYSLLADFPLFQARFAHSAPVWRNDAIIVKKLNEFLATQPSANSFFYMSLGTKETERLAGGFETLRKVLAEHDPANLRWQADRTPDAEHANNGELGTPVGFRAFYRKR